MARSNRPSSSASRAILRRQCRPPANPYSCSWARAIITSRSSRRSGILTASWVGPSWRRCSSRRHDVQWPSMLAILADLAAHLGHLDDGLQALAEAHTLREQHKEHWKRNTKVAVHPCPEP